MIRQKRILLALLTVLVLFAFTLTGCQKNKRDLDSAVKIVYELEGGIYQNCERPVVQYYSVEKDQTFLIHDPVSLSKMEISRAGYTLEGWYREKTVSEGNVTYGNKWNFETDKATGEGLTLYAHWKKNITHTYEVCYQDETDGTVKVLGKYEVESGEVFDTYYAKYFGGKRVGYTLLDGVYDIDGQVWDSAFTHPGGDTDTNVQVFLRFIEGRYKVIHNANELKANKSADLYIASDIDFGGGTFGGFGDYKGKIVGNGFTVSNFVLTYDNTKDGLVNDPELTTEGGLLCISLFNSLKDAKISNVTFSDFTIDVNVGFTGTKAIFVSPLTTKIQNTVLEGVTVENATVTCSKLPTSFNPENLTVTADRAWYYQPESDTTVVADSSFTLTDLTSAD